MKIIKVGVLPKTTHTVTCKNCTTIFEFEEKESSKTYDAWRHESILMICCQFCHFTTNTHIKHGDTDYIKLTYPQGCQ